MHQPRRFFRQSTGLASQHWLDELRLWESILMLMDGQSAWQSEVEPPLFPIPDPAPTGVTLVTDVRAVTSVGPVRVDYIATNRFLSESELRQLPAFNYAVELWEDAARWWTADQVQLLRLRYEQGAGGRSDDGSGVWQPGWFSPLSVSPADCRAGVVMPPTWLMPKTSGLTRRTGPTAA